MRRLFDLQNQQIARCSRHALIIALSALLFPTAGWAHSCGPKELTVKKGDSVEYAIPGPAPANFEVTDTGNPLVATIEPLRIENEMLAKFNVTGVGDGTTVFKIYWQGPQRQNTCPVKVTVSG